MPAPFNRRWTSPGPRSLLPIQRSAKGGHMPVMGVVTFERFFRAAAGLHVDRNDLKRFDDFVQRVVDDMVLIAQERAHASGRDVIEVADLPVTRGLRESIRAFQRL